MADFLVLNFCVQRILLPICLIASIAMRPSALSGLYLLFLLYLPLVPLAKYRTMNGHTGIYLKLLMAMSILALLTQLAFQIVLLSMPPYGNFLERCDFLEKLLRHLGYVRFDGISATDCLAWVCPDVVAVAASIAVFVALKRLTSPGLGGTSVEGSTLEEGDESKRSSNRKMYVVLSIIGKFLSLAAFCLAGILTPSVLGGLYYLVFLCCATWWACYKELQQKFAYLLRCMMIIVSLHLITFYAYQLQWSQEFLPGNSTYARYFGLTPLVEIDCEDPRTFHWTPAEYSSYLNPLFLYLLFYILAIESKLILMPQTQKKQGTFSRLEGSFNGPLNRQMSQRLSNRRLVRSSTTHHRWQTATRKVRVRYSKRSYDGESTPLIRGVSPSRRYGSGKKTPSLIQDSTGSVILRDANDDIPMHPLGTSEEQYKPGVVESILYGLESVFQMLVQRSYIATNIIMMAWSITYHSWITFVLLLWANIIWMIPNQRRSMLKCSPFLVFYAWFLLLSAYVYSMNLTEEELPSRIQNINLAQIGFQKNLHESYVKLLVKSLYTIAFWITLRQYMKERKEAKQSSALADMVAPLQVSVGAATTNMKRDTETKGSKLMKVVGDWFWKFLTKSWIWVVAITLYVVAITGNRMTGFRIIYMALFLIFILTFQLSFNLWRKIMFGFWLTVIVYSMLILIMVYTYQFDHFPEYWRVYLKIPDQQQLDIGLEIYDAKQLFVRLLTPTFFVVITVIQLHYFHKSFLEISKPKSRAGSTVEPRSEASSAQAGAWDIGSEKQDQSKKPNEDTGIDFRNLKSITPQQLHALYLKTIKTISQLIDTLWLVLEIHIMKIVLLCGMLLCVKDVSATYIFIILLLIFAFTMGTRFANVCVHIASIFVSLFLLARMVYQIEYIEHNTWTVNCTNTTNEFPIINNTAEWLGFKKTDKELPLSSFVKWNIIFMVAVTFKAIVLIRRSQARKGLSGAKKYFIFPKITRKDADKSILCCLKYLANYGYYKFGVEISFIATVVLIGTRMDMYAIFYGIWLCVLFPMSREKLSRVWIFYLIFIAIILPVQYVMVVGLPPFLCIDYPWGTTELLKRLREWAFLMDSFSPPSAKKLICDFFVFFFVTRQYVVFRIEAHFTNTNTDYPGGSNDSIIHHAEEKGFVNPVPDYITYVRSYLDIFKRGVFQSFLWITLAIVFLAGTNRVNIFSLGYLGGSFVFLWHGSDLYLKPIPIILKSWNVLLGYNIAVIVIKTVLQIGGCLFLDDLEEYTCWLVQLLGIGCVQKFSPKGPILPTDDDCNVPREYIGLAWDGVCFGFLILQKRIFQSYNFFHLIDDAKATTVLASRGAELIEELRQRRIEDQDEQERAILEKIKQKMDKIKANQQKIQGPNTKEEDSHYVEDSNEFTLDQSELEENVIKDEATSSGQTPPAGYHTPIDEEEPVPLTPHAGSLLQNQAPSPYSAIMTVSLEGYLEPQRISFSSPPNSELNPRPPSPDESFPVFSPPPYESTVGGDGTSQPPTHHRQSSIGPPWMHRDLVTPRQSIISFESRSQLSHHTYKIYPIESRPHYRRKEPKSYKAGNDNISRTKAVRSGDYYMFYDMDEEDDLEIITEKSKVDLLIDDDERAETETTETHQPTVGELLDTALKTDISTTLKGQVSSWDVRRRSSVPVVPTKPRFASTRSHMSAPLPSAPSESGGDMRQRTVQISSGGGKPPDDDQQPSTSKLEDEESLLSCDEVAKKGKWTQVIMNWILFAWAFLLSCMVSCTKYLNRFTRDYRYVIRVLTREKRQLKENTDFNIGHRLPGVALWQPSGKFEELMAESSSRSSKESISTPTNSILHTYMDEGRRLKAIDDASKEQTEDSVISDSEKVAVSKSTRSSESDDRRKESMLTVPEIRIMAPSLERGLDSPPQSDESIEKDPDNLTEMSSVDQPPLLKLLLAFWYMVLSHTDWLCYFVIFLNQMKAASFLSLPLPLMVFLWGTLTIPRPSKTFWITLIAYTEAVVLVKCIFQINVFSWNSQVSTSPFFPPRILGIERKNNYATYDLILLLFIFFHRYMLKSLGLWKTTFVAVSEYSDGRYSVQDGKMVPLQSSSEATSLNNEEVERLRKLMSRVELVSETGKESLLSKEDSSEQERIVKLETQDISNTQDLPNVIKLGVKKYGEEIKLFFQRLMDPTSRVADDIYAYMFMCDFFNFMVVIFGFAAFGDQQGDGGVSAYLEENKVPIPFLLMLILQFALIIIDRALYLRKYIMGKVVFQFLQIVGVHIWMFFILPAVTDKSFNAALPPQMWYMVKCFYLLLSAYQIRCGYPTRILGNFLCKAYNYVNNILFKVFMAVPFLFELRTIMDWMWTDTSMTISDWLKMEDIFAHIFSLKCTRWVENEYPQARGEKKTPITKYLVGGIGLIIIIAVIWFPLVFFALGNTVGEFSVPTDVTVTVRIGPYQPIYQMSAQANAIYSFDQNQFNKLTSIYNKNRVASTFLSTYEYGDVAAVKLNGNSTNIWSISPPDKIRMLDEVNSTNPLVIRLQYQVTRKSNDKQVSGIVIENEEIVLPAFTDDKKPNPTRQQLAQMLQDSSAIKPVLIQQFFPKFIKVTNRGTAKPVNTLMQTRGGVDDRSNSFRNITIFLSRADTDQSEEWWELREDCGDDNFNGILKNIPYADCEYLVLYTFNDKAFPASLSFVTGGGIIGLYTTLVFVVSRFIRGHFSEICFKIMFDDMPNVDRILQLCLNIYLVRESREFALEEDLFAKLVFLFRSPETLIKWTRPKEEVGDDEDSEDEGNAVQQ